MKRVLVSIILLAACFASEARKVTGSVKCGETIMPGITVTDGKTFTQTNRNGKFSFDIEDNAEFVYIITLNIAQTFESFVRPLYSLRE